MKFLLLNITLILFSFSNIDKEKFKGESKLESCAIIIALDYSTKGQEDLKKDVEKFKNVEIALVTKGKKGKATYRYYYLVGWESSYGPSAYLQESTSNSDRKLFLNYKDKKHAFYRADCFRDKLESEQILKDNLREEK